MYYLCKIMEKYDIFNIIYNIRLKNKLIKNI